MTTTCIRCGAPYQLAEIKPSPLPTKGIQYFERSGEHMRNYDFSIYTLDGTRRLYKATTLHHISQWIEDNKSDPNLWTYQLYFPNSQGRQGHATLVQFAEQGRAALSGLQE
jgi:hypothetical protein